MISSDTKASSGRENFLSLKCSPPLLPLLLLVLLFQPAVNCDGLPPTEHFCDQQRNCFTCMIFDLFKNCTWISEGHFCRPRTDKDTPESDRSTCLEFCLAFYVTLNPWNCDFQFSTFTAGLSIAALISLFIFNLQYPDLADDPLLKVEIAVITVSYCAKLAPVLFFASLTTYFLGGNVGISIASSVLFFIGVICMSIQLTVYIVTKQFTRKQIREDPSTEEVRSSISNIKPQMDKIIKDDQITAQIFKSLAKDEVVHWIGKNSTSHTEYGIYIFLVNCFMLFVLGAVEVKVIYHVQDPRLSMLVSITPPLVLGLWILISKIMFPTEYFLITNKKLWTFKRKSKFGGPAIQQKYLHNSLITTTSSFRKYGNFDIFVSVQNINSPRDIIQKIGFVALERSYQNHRKNLVIMICAGIVGLSCIGLAIYFWTLVWIFYGTCSFSVGCGGLFWAMVTFENFTQEEVVYCEKKTEV